MPDRREHLDIMDGTAAFREGRGGIEVKPPEAPPKENETSEAFEKMIRLGDYCARKKHLAGFLRLM